MPKVPAKLPTETASKLIKTKEKDEVLFLSFILTLRAENWPLRAIAEPFNVSRTAAMKWEARAKEHPEVEINPDLLLLTPEDSRGSGVRRKRIVPNVPKADLKKMKELAAQAKGVTRWTPNTHPAKIAAIHLEKMILHYTQERKVPVAHVAKHLNVTPRAIAQRIEKYKDKSKS